MAETSIILAFIVGIAAFLSPCILPLVPAYLTYLAGSVVGKKSGRWQVFTHAVLFVVGFTIVFALAGALLASVLAEVSVAVKTWMSRIGGTLIILFGLHIAGLLPLPWLEQEHALKFKLKPGYFTSVLFGATFAVGWTPCVGPVLGSILTLAATSPGQAFPLLLSFALGLGIPFIIAGAFVARFSTVVGKLGKYLPAIRMTVGVLLILIGILVFTQKLAVLANFTPMFLVG